MRQKKAPTKMSVLYLLFIPKDDFFVLKGCFHIDEALVRRATEAQRNIFERFDISAVNQNVDERKHFIGHVTSGVASLLPKLAVKGKARKTPNRFIGAFLAEAMQKRNKIGLVFWLEGFATEQCQAVDVIRLAGCNDFVLNLAREELTVAKIPRLRLKALLAMVGAARYK